MFNLQKLVRKNILNLNPYSSSRDEYKGTEGVFLDANENPFGELNRYPDPYQIKIKQKLSSHHSIPIDNIFIGNGSDEVIDLTLRIFCNPGVDAVLICPPTYGMYKVSAHINNIKIINADLTKDFQLNFELIHTILEENSKVGIKILFLCSPNNPTGNSFEDIEKIITNFKGIVFVDEAYIDFSKKESLLKKLKLYPNLIISQTFSKAWGLAAARVGICYSSPTIISLFNKIKPPYNVSELNQKVAYRTLGNINLFKKNVKTILEQKAILIEKLLQLPIVNKIYPSDANFILVEFKKSEFVFSQLIQKQIITRNRNLVVKDCIRITIGTPEENTLLINELQQLSQ